MVGLVRVVAIMCPQITRTPYPIVQMIVVVVAITITLGCYYTITLTQWEGRVYIAIAVVFAVIYVSILGPQSM